MEKRRQFTLPIYSGLRTRAPWRVSTSNEKDPVFFARLMVRTEQDGNATHYRWDDVAEDVFALRRRVFDLKTIDDVITLFEECGPWQVQKVADVEGQPIRFSAVLQRREFYRHALLERSIDNLARTYEGDEIAKAFENFYLWQPLPMELLFRDPPTVRVACKDIEDSLRTSVFLDRIQGFKWKRCKRQDCSQIFELKSKHEKLYCSGRCARLQSARDWIDRNELAIKSEKRITQKHKRRG